jgi:hypothetical protein
VSAVVHRRRLTERAAARDPSWLVSGSRVIVWLDFESPGPLMVVTGVFGMNVAFPQFMGGARAQFWWIVRVMLVITGAIIWWFRRRDWI